MLTMIIRMLLRGSFRVMVVWKARQCPLFGPPVAQYPAKLVSTTCGYYYIRDNGGKLENDFS